MELKYNQVDKVQIRFNDIDLLGHVNNATIGEYFDLGRMHYLHRLFGGSIKYEQESFVIASVSTTFFFPILLDFSIEVRTKITEIGCKSLKMFQCVYDDRGRKLVECSSTLVAFSTDRNETIVISEKWRSWIKGIDNDCKDCQCLDVTP